MIPGRYDIITPANATYSMSVAISGIATAVGYSARLDIRAGEEDSSTLRLSLTSGSGLTLSSNGSSLTVAVVITEAQIDTLRATQATNGTPDRYSLKVTAPDTTTLQYLAGAFVVTATPTP